jgi:catechol 2,3-dioxygenase-like lactoylglutathione lyase family enzyme
MIKRLAHVNILSKDLAASEHFYCEVLGMKRVFDFLENDTLFGFYLDAGEMTFIEIFKQREAVNLDRPLIPHLCFEVEDIDATIAAIRSKGWAITDKKQGGDQAWQAWMTDPDGVAIEVMQYTKESSHFTGKPCIIHW